MSQFIIRNEEAAARVEETLRGGYFQNAGVFIQLYNANVINRSHDENKQIVADILDAYKNVKEYKRQLVFISAEEVLLDEVQSRLAPWGTLARAKREVATLIAENENVVADSVLVVSEDGELSALVRQGEGEVLLELDSERIFSKQEGPGILPNYSSISSEHDPQYNGWLFVANDFDRIDTSFIHEINKLVP